MSLSQLLLLPLGLLYATHLFSAPGDLVLPRKEDSVSVQMTVPSIFSHWKHRIHYRCDACHDELFKMQLGATEISMDLMNQDKSCATCHNGKIAFGVSFDNCNRCHRPPMADDPKTESN